MLATVFKHGTYGPKPLHNVHQKLQIPHLQ